MYNIFFSKQSKFSWHQLPWYEIKNYVFKMQKNIYRASIKNCSYLEKIQLDLINNIATRLLATEIAFQTYNKNLNDYITNDNIKLSIALSLKFVNISTSETAILWNQKSSTFMLSSDEIMSRQLVTDLIKQIIAKFILEPEWEAKFSFDEYNLASSLGDKDIVETLLRHKHKAPYLIINLSKSLKCYQFEELHEISLFFRLKTQIYHWLKLGLLSEYILVESNPDFIFKNQYLAVYLAPLLLNIILFSLKSKVFSKTKQVPLYNYKSYLISVPNNVALLVRLAHLLKTELGKIHINITSSCLNIPSKNIDSNILGYSIVLGAKGITRSFNKHKYAIAYPSIYSTFLFVQNNRDTIQNLKSGSMSSLIKKLRFNIRMWAQYYSNCSYKNTAKVISKIMFTQIRAIIFRRHPNKSRSWIKKKYLPDSGTYLFCSKLHQSSWTLTTYVNDMMVFLPNIQWYKEVQHIEVIKSKSFYDNDCLYWQSRMESEACY